MAALAPPIASRRRKGRARRVAPGAVALAALLGCGPSEEELRLAELQDDIAKANATIDSLNYNIESSNLLIDEMRSRVDSLQVVDEKLLESVQRLNQEVQHWRTLAGEHRVRNEQLTQEIARLKREKQADERSIARMRSEADSLNAALLAAHTSIRRQEDRVRRLEEELGQVSGEAALLRQAETSVRLYVATEGYLKEDGYLVTDRIFGRAFTKSYRLVRRLDPSDPKVRLVQIGEPVLLEGSLEALVDRFGELKSAETYRSRKADAGVEVTFVDEMLGGSDVLAILKR